MNTGNKTIVIITSVIYSVDKALSYSSKRSIFSPEQRLEQTKKTIASIREKIPEAEIFLFEQGINSGVSTEFEKLVDSYQYIGDNFWVRKATDSMFKGLGEAIGLIYASRFLPKDTMRFFKISGRYYLNENFHLSDWSEGSFIVKRYHDTISTRLYSFTGDMLPRWRRALILSISPLLLNRSIEKTLSLLIPKKYYKELSVLGVSGEVGVNAEIISE